MLKKNYQTLISTSTPEGNSSFIRAKGTTDSLNMIVFGFMKNYFTFKKKNS